MAPRLLGDVLAVSAGLATFWLVVGNLPYTDVLFACGYVVFALLIDVTHVRREWNYVEEFIVAMKTALAALLLVAVGGFLVNRPVSRIMFVSIVVAMVVTRPLAAVVVDRLGRSVRQPPSGRTVVALCDDDEYRALASALGAGGPLTDLVRVDAGAGERGAGEDLGAVCERYRPAKVVVGEAYMRDAVFLAELARVNEMGFTVRSYSRSFEEDFGRVPVASLDTSWFLFDIGPLHRLGYRLARRLVDIVAGLVAGVALVLFLPFVALVIRLDSPGPVFFVQTRVGQRGRPFRIYKFRTMNADAEAGGPCFARADDERMTRVGRMLRRCRIDEMPQALNLLRGDMSLIGPRPERPEFVEGFRDAIPFYEKRTLIKPGITGWAQVHEGYGSSVDDMVRKLERDLYYLRYQSLGVDLRILMATTASILRFAGR
jgi:exopolysaccharide biosynthesis polyprenyl glycosylphosphotransferase